MWAVENSVAHNIRTIYRSLVSLGFMAAMLGGVQHKGAPKGLQFLKPYNNHTVVTSRTLVLLLRSTLLNKPKFELQVVCNVCTFNLHEHHKSLVNQCVFNNTKSLATKLQLRKCWKPHYSS